MIVSVRLDKWLWCARIFKTRSLATAACRKGAVTIAGQPVKPAREAQIGDILVVKKNEVTHTFKVVQLLDHRVGAKLSPEFVEDQTPASELEKQRAPDFRPIAFRPKGAGRPTKKDRRLMEKFDHQP